MQPHAQKRFAQNLRATRAEGNATSENSKTGVAAVSLGAFYVFCETAGEISCHFAAAQRRQATLLATISFR